MSLAWLTRLEVRRVDWPTSACDQSTLATHLKKAGQNQREATSRVGLALRKVDERVCEWKRRIKSIRDKARRMTLAVGQQANRGLYDRISKEMGHRTEDEDYGKKTNVC